MKMFVEALHSTEAKAPISSFTLVKSKWTF